MYIVKKQTNRRELINMVKKYKVYDLADNWADVLGYATTMHGVKKLARERMEDTDGDCSIFYAISEDGKTYDFKNRTFLETC